MAEAARPRPPPCVAPKGPKNSPKTALSHKTQSVWIRMNVLFSDFFLYGRRALRVPLQMDGHPDLVPDLVPDLRPPEAESMTHTNLVPTAHTFRIFVPFLAFLRSLRRTYVISIRRRFKDVYLYKL